MTRAIFVPRYLISAILCAASLAGCVATSGARGATTPPGKPGAAASAPHFPTITLETQEGATLGQAIRQLGETGGGGAVLVAGLEDWPASEVQLQASAFVPGLERLVADRDCKLQVLPDYVFIYPPGYEQLEALSLAGQLDPRYAALTASFAVGAGTDLYNALALLGNSLGVTLVADNLVADAWCGELFLENAPLPAILEALLKSARVPATSIQIESTSEYVFFRSVQNGNAAPACLNAGELTAEQRLLLSRNVNLRLPRDASGAVFEPGPSPLSEVLASLSAQLGAPVTADPEMADLPVHPAVLNGISIETALNLLVWQWPLPRFGYQVSGAGIHFRLR